MPDTLRLLVITQRHEPTVPQVRILGPLHKLKLKLPDELRLELAAIFHFRRRQPDTPAAGLLCRHVQERAFGDFERL
jgi:hypothetical protein